MSNTERRITSGSDKGIKTLVPINIDGDNSNDKLFTPIKIVTICTIIGTFILGIAYMVSNNSPLKGWLSLGALWFICSVFALRFLVFEEPVLYKNYRARKKNHITTPAISWEVAFVEDTYDGAILTYTDARIAVIIKLERDTITGKAEEGREIHYDAVSDFLREIAYRKLSFVYMDIMEEAGSDPRLPELDRLITQSDNPNIRKFVELEVGHIKNLARNTLSDFDYYMIFTDDTSRIDTLMKDVIESADKIMEASYVGYEILYKKDIIELEKKQTGVKYFNLTEATLRTYENNQFLLKNVFKIKSITFSDGRKRLLNDADRFKLKGLIAQIESGVYENEQLDIREALGKEKDAPDMIKIVNESKNKSHSSKKSGVHIEVNKFEDKDYEDKEQSIKDSESTDSYSSTNEEISIVYDEFDDSDDEYINM